jgi:hypothetical protein
MHLALSVPPEQAKDVGVDKEPDERHSNNDRALRFAANNIPAAYIEQHQNSERREQTPAEGRRTRLETCATAHGDKRDRVC